MKCPVLILIGLVVLAALTVVMVRSADERGSVQRYEQWETCVLNSPNQPDNSAGWPRNCGNMPQP